MSDQAKITGGCLCGAVRYEVTRLPGDSAYYCHCRMCQKALGALFGCFVRFSGPNIDDRFKFTRTPPEYYKSSAWAERGFCPDCGTPLVIRDLNGFAVTIGIRASRVRCLGSRSTTICHAGKRKTIHISSWRRNLKMMRTRGGR